MNWIEIEKELPPINKRVFLFSDSKNENKGIVIGSYKGNECGDNPCYSVLYIDEITFFGYTHWQPLMEIPFK